MFVCKYWFSLNQCLKKNNNCLTFCIISPEKEDIRNKKKKSAITWENCHRRLLHISRKTCSLCYYITVFHIMVFLEVVIVCHPASPVPVSDEWIQRMEKLFWNTSGNRRGEPLILETKLRKFTWFDASYIFRYYITLIYV